MAGSERRQSTIVDSSVIVAFLMKESNAKRSYKQLSEVLRSDLIVPALLSLEVGNVLRTNLKRGRLTEEALNLAITGFRLLPMRMDSLLADRDHILEVVLPMAKRWELTVYDAVYVELALRTKGELATRDEAMARTAAVQSITLAF